MPARTDQEKLALLSEFDEGRIGTGGRKLTIRADGSFERISGFTSNIFSRGDNDSLTVARNYTAVRDLFLRRIQALAGAATAAETQAVCDAFRGYSRLVKRGYHGRMNQGFEQSYKDVSDALSSALRRQMTSIRQGNCGGMIYQYIDHQKNFITAPQILGKGVCWGIACKWGARWVVDGKEGYGATKQGGFVSLDRHNLNRLYRKSPEIYALQNKQNILKDGGNVGDVMSARFVNAPLQISMLAPVIVQNSARTINTNLDTLFQNRPAGGPQSAQHGDVQALLAAKGQKYNRLHTSATQAFPTERFFSRVWNDAVVQETFDAIFNHMKAAANAGPGRSAFIVGFMTRRENQSRYFTSGGGHAMACFRHDANNWFFMDPNFGEWYGTEPEVKQIMCKVASYYSVSHDFSQWDATRLYAS